MPARRLYFEGVHVGDELPALAKAPIDRVQLARYAGASGDFNPVHVDEVYARGTGMPSVYAPGMLVMGFLGQLVSDWARGAQLRRYSVRFIKMVWPGDTVVCKGRVTDRSGEDGRYFAELELWAENQKGELVMKGQSQIQLFYSLEDETRQRAGQGAIVVNVPRQSLITQPPPLPPSPPPKAEPVPAPLPPATVVSKKRAREKPAAKKASIKPPKRKKKAKKAKKR
jgi:acyl dehydratase